MPHQGRRALPGYEPLAEVLDRALEQAQAGKGNERHANGLPFLEQPIMVEQRQQKGTGFTVGQARKKALESMGLPPERAVRELLGAINYLAAGVLWLEEREERGANNTSLDVTREYLMTGGAYLYCSDCRKSSRVDVKPGESLVCPRCHYIVGTARLESPFAFNPDTPPPTDPEPTKHR